MIIPIPMVSAYLSAHLIGWLLVPAGARRQSLSIGVAMTSLTSSQRSWTLSPGPEFPASPLASSAKAACADMNWFGVRSRTTGSSEKSGVTLSTVPETSSLRLPK